MHHFFLHNKMSHLHLSDLFVCSLLLTKKIKIQFFISHLHCPYHDMIISLLFSSLSLYLPSIPPQLPLFFSACHASQPLPTTVLNSLLIAFFFVVSNKKLKAEISSQGHSHVLSSSYSQLKMIFPASIFQIIVILSLVNIQD